ncbi:MAG: hypothetical protein NXI24_00760 [bacterium]|nr:hypothetical protein [bacterium]
MEADNNSLSVAAVDVKIDGRTQSAADASALKELLVEDCINRPTMFCVKYMIYRERRKSAGLDGAGAVRIDKVDDDIFEQFSLGAEIEVQLGINETVRMMTGRVAALEPDYDPANPCLAVRGYDGMFDLRFGTKSRSFTDIKDSTIAQQLAAEAGLGADITDTRTIHPYLFQNNQSNYDFLCERAERLDYELLIEDDRVLRFGPPREAQEPEAELDFAIGGEIKQFYPRMKTLTRDSEIELRGWDVNRKQLIQARARRGDELVIPRGGQRSGFDYSVDGFRDSASTIIDEPLIDDSDAQNLAQARYRRSLRGFITGEGVAKGDPRIRAGRTVRITSIGSKFSGVYYVVSSRHHFTSQGYETSFKVRRPNI